MDKTSHLITSYGLSQSTSRRAYNSVFKPAVEYVLTSSYMMKEELDKAQAKSTRSFLQAMGYNPHFPRTAAYAPKEIGGIGLNRLYTKQGIRNVSQLMKHIRARTSVGDLFLIALDWAKLWAGTKESILCDTETILPENSARFLASIREFLIRCKAKIRTEEKHQEH